MGTTEDVADASSAEVARDGGNHVIDPDSRDATSHLSRLIKGGAWLAAGDLFNYATRVVGALLLARLLTAEDYGRYIIAVSLAFLAAGLANLGLDASTERYAAVLGGENRPGDLRFAVRFGTRGALLGGVISGVIVVIATPSIAGGVFDDDTLTPLLRLVGLSVPLVVMTTLLSATMRGFHRMDYSAMTENVLQPLVRVGLVVIIAFVGLTVDAAVIIFAISYLVPTLVLARLLRRLNPASTTTAATGRAVLRREMATFAFPFWFSGLLRQAKRSVQPILLGVHTGLASAGVMSLVTSANLFSRVLSMSIRKALRPTLATLLNQGRLVEAEHLYRATTRWMLSAALPVSIVMILYPSDILAVFGSGFTKGATAMIIIAATEVVTAATGTSGVVIDMSDLGRVKMINKTSEVGLTVGLNVILIAQWGLVGAAVASLVATATIQLVRVVEVRLLVGISPYSVELIKPIIAATTAFAAGYGFDRLLVAGDGLMHLAANAAVVVGTYAAVLVAVGITPDDRRLLGKVVQRLRAGRAKPRSATKGRR